MGYRTPIPRTLPITNTDMEEEYLVIGSNNFWYSIEDTEKDARITARSILEGEEGYEDPETGNEPSTPSEVFIYKASKVAEL